MTGNTSELEQASPPGTAPPGSAPTAVTTSAVVGDRPARIRTVVEHRHVRHWSDYLYRTIAAEVSATTRYYDRVIQWRPRARDTGFLLASIDCPAKQIAEDFAALPDLRGEANRRSAILLNGTFNHSHDIQALLTKLKAKLARTSRVLVIAYNPYLRWLYALANRIGLRADKVPGAFLTRTDLDNIAKISGYEVVRHRPAVYAPFRMLGLGSFINRLLPSLPVLRWLCGISVIALRPIIEESSKPSLSILIPARNERGNVENALKRMPDFGGAHLEIIFVEGHSTDGTWEEIQRVIPLYSSRFTIKSFKQTGKGKSDAVRLGFSKATGDLLTILDADLTMPPELLERFYDSYCEGLADFINGSRLLYPMEGEAMRFLNRLGNVFFARALSFVLGARLGDSLCGTKLVSRHDYARFTRWRADFGEFDPFGDFELLFPASVLALGTVDIPIRYRARTYGSTQINRFEHGWMLLKMTAVGFVGVKMGRVPGH